MSGIRLISGCHNRTPAPSARNIIKKFRKIAATGMASVSGTNLNQAVLDETVVLQPVKAFFTPKAGGAAPVFWQSLRDIQLPP